MVLTYSHRITRVLWYSGIASITPWFRLRDYYSVSSNFPVAFDYHFAFSEATLTPMKRISLVWAHSLSLTTTNEIVITFFSSRYLDVSVPWVPFTYTILFIYGYCHITGSEFPHSEIYGSQFICNYP